MPLYEIVLRYPDRDEIRITDRNGYEVGGEVVIAGRRFVVSGTEPAAAAGPQPVPVDVRFVIEPRDEHRAS